MARSRWSRAIGKSDRSKKFQKASEYYWGEQYNDLKAWDDPDTTIRMRERAPSVHVRMNRAAVNTVNAHLFGAGRLPQFKVLTVLDSDGLAVPEELLEDSDRERLAEINRKIQRIRKKTRIDQHLMELGRNGLLHGSVALAGHISESGRMWCEVIQVADSKLTLASDDRARAEELGLEEDDILELDEYWISTEFTLDEEVKYYVNRRTWTPEATTEYLPVETEDAEGGEALEEIDWQVDNEKTVNHDNGVTSAVWVRNIRVAGDKYGAPLVDEPEFKLEDEVNYTLSQSGRALRYNAEPKMVMSDVANIQNEEAFLTGSQHTLHLDSYGTPGVPPASAKFLEMSGAGQTVAFEYIKMLRKLYQSVTSVIEHDPEAAVGALSGIAIERLMMPLVSLVGALRENYAASLARWFEIMLELSGEEGFVEVSVVWPRIIEPTNSDLALIATPLIMLYQADVILLETVVEVLSPLFKIEEIQEYIDKLAAADADGGTSTDAAADADDDDDDGL